VALIFCKCGCLKRVLHEGQRYLHGHHRRLAGVKGYTHSNEPAKQFVDLDIGKNIGSLFPVGVHKKPYDVFESQAEAILWWVKNRRSFMGEAMRGYIGDGSICPGSRANIFWELEFAVPYPSAEQEILLIEVHDLWWPGEREKVIGEGRVIPNIAKCHMHAFGYPVDFPKPTEAVVRIIDGRLKRGLHPSCEACNLIYAEREDAKRNRNLKNLN